MPPEFTQSRKKLNMPVEYKYTFTNIFQPDVTQNEIFAGCVAPLIKDLFAGQHCLLFTYGTTNAGKTFTVLGTGDKPGILPRTLTTVFKTIKGKEYNNDRIRPHMFNSAWEVTDSTLMEELSFKQNILTWSHDKTQSDSSHLGKTNATAYTTTDEIIGESVFREMQRRLTNDTSIVEHDSEPEDRFSLWVSFAEIYNEAIFDLLQPVTIGGKRKQLKLAQDGSRNMYIKGLRYVFVQSEEEAYKVLMFGKNNLHVAATGMNSRSSRSHCIFTIKLMKCPNVEAPETVTVSSISICDLAGAERQKKTLNAGLRLKESQNINCSLHVLSRCFNTIRENQLNNENKLIPFRDSKLTHLFQHALQGKETVTMIVNVNPEPHLCEETQHVLKASATAKHIVVQPRMVQRPNRVTRASIFSEIVSRHNRSSTLIRWDSCVRPKAPGAQSLVVEDSIIPENEPSETDKKQQNYENLIVLVEDLKEKMKEEKVKHLQTRKAIKKREEEIRKEMKDELQHLLNKAKEQHKLDDQRARDAGVIEERVSGNSCVRSAKKMKRRFEEEDEFNLPDEIEDLKEEVQIQRKEIYGLTELVNMMKEEKKELTLELTGARLQLGWKDRDIKELKAKIEMFGEESELKKGYLALEKEMESKLKIRENLLEEARSDLLEEIRMKEEAEEELEKLEKEITEKDQEIASLQNEIEEWKQEVTAKSNALDMMENHIEGVECGFDEEIRNLERNCSKLEKELTERNKEVERLTQLLAEEEVEYHLQQVTTLQAEVDKLLFEKTVVDEQLLKLNKDFEEYKKEKDKEIESVIQNQEEERLRMYETNLDKQSEAVNDMKLKYEKEILDRDNLITQLQEKLMVALQKLEETKESIKSELIEKYDERVVEVVIDSEEKHKQDIENLKTEFFVERNELEMRVLDFINQLELERRERECIKEELEAAKRAALEMNKSLMDKSSKIKELEKFMESMQQEKAKYDSEHSTEVSILERTLKQQIQETENQMSLQTEKLKENEKLLKDLAKWKSSCDELKEALRNKEHDLECSQSKMAAYDNLVPTLQAELQQLRKEKGEYKRRCEDQVAAIFNMEQETNSFHANQKEIIGKYEDQLKKTKDENETLKKEVARLANTFYKSTPTPKKDLEKQNERLRREIEDLSRQLDESKATCQKLQEVVEHTKGRPTTVKLLLPNEDVTRFSSQAESTCSEPPDIKVMSTSKIRPRRTRATAAPVIQVSDFDQEAKLSEIPQKQTRKQLWDTNTQDTTLEFEDVKIDMSVPHDSPGTVVKRCLRKRNKLGQSMKKSASEMGTCVGCFPQQQNQNSCGNSRSSRRKLFSQDSKVLQELNIELIDVRNDLLA
ncbi:kinesin-like protein KIF20B isoform X2 [Homalodisca vitripennis]|uniref:kinesin-like protein KIF20B isoform X2 n=1 Tax=Homalodisca vitripennis TaxID=197043 RepID=UPI001EEB922E|nr:kinesin-like protein KIF20B isoform X2 [Homalodisca vitripennis]